MAPSNPKAKLASTSEHKKSSEVLKNEFLSNSSGNSSTDESSPKTFIFRGNMVNVGDHLEGSDSDDNASKVPVPAKKTSFGGLKKKPKKASVGGLKNKASVGGLKKMPKKNSVKKVIKPRVVAADSDDGFESDNSSKTTLLLPTKKTSGLKQSSSAGTVSVAKSSLKRRENKAISKTTLSLDMLDTTTPKKCKIARRDKVGSKSPPTSDGDGIENLLDDISSSDEDDEPLDTIDQFTSNSGPSQSTSKQPSQSSSKPGSSQSTSKHGASQSTSKYGSIATAGPSKSTVQSVEVKRISRSTRAGVIFPVGRLHRQLRKFTHHRMAGKTAPVFMAGVLEYLVAEILELAVDETKKMKKRRITPKALELAIRCDEDFAKILKSVTIPECGGGGVSKFYPPTKSAPPKNFAKK